MKKTTLALLGALAGAWALAGFATSSKAAERRANQAATVEASYQMTNGRYARRRPLAARAYRGRRIGFYSYTYRDVINTYGMSRTKYGSINSYRDPFLDRQTVNGPFDHGFFFDSGIAPRGGDSPYLH